MIIRSISAENFGKFDRYTVNLDDNINVFYGDNEAGKTTLYEIISLLLFAPTTDEEMVESSKLIKKGEKYARVYAIINIDGKEISVAREIYVNDTILSIAEQENVSSLGNVNVPFIGDLTKEMYESFHTIDYYNMATITNNVWQQIVNVIEDSHGALRITPDYSSEEGEETVVIEKSKFEDEIAKREKEKTGLKVKLKEAQRKQKRMIKNQDKIDDLVSEFEDIENNIELESSYLKEAVKMNQIRDNIKKTQDLSLELEKYKNLKPWMPNLREYYDRLKLYGENKANGIENPLDMFDDLEEKEVKPEKEETTEKPVENKEAEGKIEPAETAPEKTEEKADAVEEMPKKEVDAAGFETPEEIEPVEQNDTQQITEDDYKLSEEKINKFIEESYLKYDHTTNEDADDADEDKVAEDAKEYMTSTSAYLHNKIEHLEQENQSDDDTSDDKESVELPKDVKTLEIRKPKDIKNNSTDPEDRDGINTFGQTNPYSDNILPDMDSVDYSGKNVSQADDGDDSEDNDDKYSLSESNNLPTQTKKVSENDMNSENNKENEKKNGLLEAEEYLNAVNMQEIIAASQEQVEVDDETREEIDRAQLTFKIRAKKIFDEDVDMEELSQKLKKLNTNAIYKTIVRYKTLSQKQRKLEHNVSRVEHKKTTSGTSLALGFVAVLSMLLGLACFFIDQIVTLFPEINALSVVNQVIMELPLNNIIAGNILSGGAFVLIAILLAVAIVLGNDSSANLSEQASVDDVELDELKNRIRMAKREVIDALKNFPIPPKYLDNPNNTIISIINELREAETAHNDLVIESTMPRNENYRAIWKLTKTNLNDEEMSTDLFDNIAKLRIKIKDYKEELKDIERKQKEKEQKLNEQKKRINMVATASGHPGIKLDSNNSGQLDSFDNFNKPLQSNEVKSSSASITIPKSEPNTLSMNTNEIPGAKSPSIPFGLPQTGTDTVENIPFGLPQADTDSAESISLGLPQVSTNPAESETISKSAQNLPFGMPDSQPGDMDAVKDESYQSESNALNAPKDMGYPSAGTGFNTPKDMSYPSEGNEFGSTKDMSYPAAGNEFGEAKDAGNLSEDTTFGAVKDAGYSIDSSEDGVAKDTPFPAEPKTPQSQATPVATEENDFGIPGIHRYTGAQQSKPTDSTAKSDSQYGIPSINKYDNNSSVQPDASTEKDPFGIPGIHKYTGAEQSKQAEPIIAPSMMETNKDEMDKPAEPQEQKTMDLTGRLPGSDKFSNRGEQSANNVNEKTDSIPAVDVPIVPLAGTPVVEATGAVVGAAILGGLPGLAKFSNRNEQVAQKPEEVTPTVQDEIKAQPMEEDPFAIPGIKRYTGTEQKADENKKAVETVAEPVADEPEGAYVLDAKEAESATEAEEEKEPERIVVKDRREKEYDELLELLGDDPESTVREVEDITRALHREKTRRDSAMANLLKLNDAAIRLSTLSSNKWPYKQKAITASQERIDYLEADKLKMGRHVAMLESKIDEVVYEGTPQAISDRTTAIEKEIEQLKLENDKHAIAEELMEKRKLLDLSSNADRSHVIDDTSEYMKELTLGKYVKVEINDGLTGLSICDKDGQWFDTTKDRLSQATREQLYLALRISIADLFDEKSLIFPMFFDEALITWDKRRMKAVMRLLSKMSMHRQVIIFTCHDWLKDMISDYLIGAKIIIM